MKLRIYTEGTTTGATLDVETSDAKVSRELCGKDQITFTVKSSVYIDVPLWSAIQLNTPAGLWLYKMHELPAFEEKSNFEFNYTFTFKSPIFQLERIGFRKPYVIDGTTYYKDDFYFSGRATDHLDLIFTNINRVIDDVPTNFTKGVAPTDKFLNIQYSNVNCLGALNLICDAFDLEYEHYQAYLNLKQKVGNDTLIVARRGMGELLSTISRNTVDVDKMVTRLYYRGSDRNLPLGYPHDRLRGSSDFTYLNTSVNGVVEASHNFDDIYPTRTGIVSSYNYNSTQKIYSIVDSTMDFDLNEVDESGNTLWRIPGTAPKMNFLTGNCAGRTFEIEKYSNSTKLFRIIPDTSESGYSVPNDVIYPAPGDTYTLIDVRLPQSYVDDSISRLDSAAVAWLYDYAYSRVSYPLKANPLEWNLNGVSISLGDRLTVENDNLDISSTCRVITLDFPLSDIDDVTIKLSDVRFAVLGRKKAIEAAKTRKILSDSKLNTVEKVQKNKKSTAELKSTILDFRDGNLNQALIKPSGVDPYQLALDSGELQFSIKDIEFVANKEGNKNVLGIVAGSIIHHSINAKTRDQIIDLQDLSEEYIPQRTWSVSATDLTLASESTSYFIYLKIPILIGQSIATIIIDEDHLWPKSIENYILYKVGYVSKVIDGVARKVKTIWGDSLSDACKPKTNTVYLTKGTHPIIFKYPFPGNYSVTLSGTTKTSSFVPILIDWNHLDYFTVKMPVEGWLTWMANLITEL